METGEYVSYVEQVVLTGLESENWNLYHDESSAVNPRSFYVTLAQGEIAGSNQRLFLNDKYPIMKSMTQNVLGILTQTVIKLLLLILTNGLPMLVNGETI